MVILLIVSLQVLVEWEDESMTLAPGEVSLRAFPNTILQDHADHSEAVPQKRPDLWRVSAAGVVKSTSNIPRQRCSGGVVSTSAMDA